MEASSFCHISFCLALDGFAAGKPATCARQVERNSTQQRKSFTGRSPAIAIVAMRSLISCAAYPVRPVSRQHPHGWSRPDFSLGYLFGIVTPETSLSAIDLRLSQLLHRCLGTDRRIVNLFEGIRPRPGADHRQNFYVPMIV